LGTGYKEKEPPYSLGKEGMWKTYAGLWKGGRCARRMNWRENPARERNYVCGGAAEKNSRMWKGKEPIQ